MQRLHVPIAVRWADLDAFGHVNNVDLLRLLEEARVTAFWRHPDAPQAEAWPTAVLDAGPQAPVQTLIARQEVEYRRPVPFTRTPLRVEMWLGHLGGASLDVCYEVHDGPALDRIGPASGDEAYARAVTTIVIVDVASGRPQRLDATAREAWEPYVGEPLTFRRRS